MFSADGLENVRQMFVLAFGFEGQSKFAKSKFVRDTKWWTKEREVFRKVEQRVSKWWKEYPRLQYLCSAQHFRNGCWRSTSHGINFGKQTIKISRFRNSRGDVYQKRSHLCPRSSWRHKSIFRYTFALFHHKYTQHCSRMTGITTKFCITLDYNISNYCCMIKQKKTLLIRDQNLNILK